jgi:hypothetical protein
MTFARAVLLQALVFSALSLISFAGCGGSPSAPSPITVPTLSAPADDLIGSTRPTLTLAGATTTNTTYDFQVSLSGKSLASGTGIVASATGVVPGADGQVSFTVGSALEPAKRYYWRARAVQGGRAGSWTQTFRFRTEGSANQSPTIQSFAAGNMRADAGSAIEVRATVQDADSDLSKLTYTWSAPSGEFSGTGPTVSWRPPSEVPNPGPVTLTLTVTDAYTLTDADGVTDARENKVSGTVAVNVNNSPKEISDLVLTFLDDFVHPERTAAYCVRNFSDNCVGKQEEFSDITNNRARYVIDPARSSFRIHSITYQVTRNGALTSSPNLATWATVLAPCKFGSTEKATGVFGVADGTCRLTTTYENFRWRPLTTNAFDSFSLKFIF